MEACGGDGGVGGWGGGHFGVPLMHISTSVYPQTKRANLVPQRAGQVCNQKTIGVFEKLSAHCDAKEG